MRGAGIVVAPIERMRTILIVDDCRPVAQILAHHLSRAGYAVSFAADGVDALVSLAQKRPDCILLDLMMPLMTGDELLHRLKQDPATADIPIVLVSSRVGEGRAHIFSERDADYCVGKPFTRLQVLEAVAAALGEPAPCSARSAQAALGGAAPSFGIAPILPLRRNASISSMRSAASR